MEKDRHLQLVITCNGPQMASINLSPLGRLGRFRIATLGSMAVKQGYNTRLDIVLLAGAADDRGVLLLDHHFLGAAEHIDGDVLELDAQIGGDQGAGREDRNVLEVLPPFHTFTTDTQMIEDTAAQYKARMQEHAEKTLGAATDAAQAAGIACETIQVEHEHPYGRSSTLQS